jgi:hypothetical protein
MPLTSPQPNTGHQLQAQSVRCWQDKIPHRQQLRSLATVFHLAEPFCPLLSLNVNTQVTTWQDSTQDSYIIHIISPRHRAHPAPHSCIRILWKLQIWKSTPDRKYILSAVSHTYNYCINRVSCDRQLQENKSTPVFFHNSPAKHRPTWCYQPIPW